MKSPTSTILHSIQALKSKLRSDHLQLQGIRRDFAMGPTRPIIETDQRSQSPVLANFKSNSSLQKNARAKLLQVRKHHQLETKQLHQRYKRQKQELIKDYEQKIQEMTKIFENKLNEQVSYIAMLQEQVQQKQKEQIQTQNPIYFQIQKQKQKEDKSISPMKKSQDIRLCSKVYQLNCTEMTFDNKINFKLFGNSERGSQCGRIVDCGAQKLEEETVKYERIVNKLLQENAVLLQSVQTLKMQNRKLKHDNLVKSKAEEQQQYSVKDHFKYETTKIQQQRSISQSRSSQYLSVMPLVHQVGQHSSYRPPNLPPTQVNKTRLKFSKATDRAKTQTDRSYSSIGNQNIDLSNIQYRNANSIEKHDEEQKYQKSIVEEDEESILCEEMKLKTIKHFMKAISHRSTQCEQYVDTHVEARFVPQMPIKKGVGLRNALRRISIL